MMPYYPIFLRLEGRPCLVIGGGEVGERKVGSILRAGGVVTVISPTLTPALSARVSAGEIVWCRRDYRRGDLRGSFLAYAATDDEVINASVATEAADEGVLLNVVDRPASCSFIVPSVVEQGDLVIATSTGGTSPLLARRIRERLSAEFGPEYAAFLRILGCLRQRLGEEGRSAAERQRLFGALIDSPLLETLRAGDWAGADRVLAATLGPPYTLHSLGVVPDTGLPSTVSSHRATA